MLRWLRSWWRPSADAVIADLIRPPRVLYTGLDDQLRSQTEARRSVAEAIRQRAARVEAGEVQSTSLRRIK